MQSTFLRVNACVKRTLLLTYPSCEYGSFRDGNRATIPCAYFTLTLLERDVLIYEFNETITQINKIKNNPILTMLFRASLYDSYPYVCAISAASMFIICLLVASFRDPVFAYSRMMCSPPGFVERIFSINLNGVTS